jgi:PAS domain S-box-containing protein
MSPVKILLVDDREENLIALEALLSRDDIRLFSTTSANEALKIAWDNDIAIALIDVQMPEMDGFELVELLKSNPQTKNILIIFVTAISKEVKYVVKGLGIGAIDYLYKPLDPFITSAKVDSFIQLARHQADIRKKNEDLKNFALVVKNSADIICTVDAQNFSIKTINPAVEKLLGFKADELVHKSIIDLVTAPQRLEFKTKLGGMIKNNPDFAVFEFQFNTFDKRATWAECRVSYRNKIFFLNISDISYGKSYQQQLLKSKENAELSKKIKEAFLANMSHELRTPISGIIGLIDLLKQTPINDKQGDMLGMLEDSSQSLLGVINDILDISKIEAGKFNIIRTSNDLYGLVNSVYNLLKFKADKKDIEFISEIEPAVPQYIMVDSLRLNQVLMNLLSNAINFTEKGYVKLKVSLLQSDADKVKLKFIVEDSGIGIPAESLPTIFNSFEQAADNTYTKYGGTGLGLTIVKKLVELKGGELMVSSEVGAGSVFGFNNWYKVTDKPKGFKDTKPDKVLSAFKNMRVLVVEDNLINQFMLSKMLKNWEMVVDMADNGRKALEKLKINTYDLVLMDTHMPEMNGYEAARHIRLDLEEPTRSIPIISLSAAALDHEQSEALSAGMNDVLSKPFQPHQLHEKIKKLLLDKQVTKKPI